MTGDVEHNGESGENEGDSNMGTKLSILFRRTVWRQHRVGVSLFFLCLKMINS